MTTKNKLPQFVESFALAILLLVAVGLIVAVMLSACAWPDSCPYHHKPCACLRANP